MLGGGPGEGAGAGGGAGGGSMGGCERPSWADALQALEVDLRAHGRGRGTWMERREAWRIDARAQCGWGNAR